MIRTGTGTALTALLGLLAGCQATLPSPEPLALEGGRNVTAADDVYVTGALDASAVDALAERGAKAMIDLRQPDQIPEGYAEIVQAHGLTYTNVPLRSEGMSADDAARIEAALRGVPSRNLVIACGSANRAGAAYALYASKRYRCTVAEALELGRRAGLRNEQLAADVQQQLEAE